MRTTPALGTALVLLLAGCNSGADPTVTPSDADTVAASQSPSAQPSASEPTEPAAEPTPSTTDGTTRSQGRQTVELWYVRDNHNRGPFVEPERHRLDERTTGVARAALEALLDAEPRDPGLTNPIPDGTQLLGVNLEGRTLTVDLDFPNDDVGLGAGFEAALYEQIRQTAAQFDTVRRVEILEEGGDPTSGHFLPGDLRGPARPDKFAVSPIVVTRPRHHQKIATGQVTIRGNANVFEATVGLTLVDPDGEIVEETFTTATCGTGCRGTFSHTFTIDEPGRWTVVATEDDASDGEGGGPFTTERTFTVR